MSIVEFYNLKVSNSYVKDCVYGWMGVVSKREFGNFHELIVTIDCGLNGIHKVSSENFEHVYRLKEISGDSFEDDLFTVQYM